MNELVQAAIQLGVCAVMALFFVWQSHVRELRLQSQIDELNTYIRATLHELVDRALEAIGRTGGENPKP